jgi:hypothetical protein
VAQIEDLLGAEGFELDAAALTALDAASAIDIGYPAALLGSAGGNRMVHGEHSTVGATQRV